VNIRATTAMAPMAMPAIAPADKAGFGEKFVGELVGRAVADDLGGVTDRVASEDAVGVIEVDVVTPT
jgi:hypothetical protein